MDHHFLESIHARVGGKTIQEEAAFGVRIALSLANEVLIPASSYVESKLCRGIVNKYRHIFQTGKIKLIGTGNSFHDYCESSLYQYDIGSERHKQYKNAKRLHAPPFKSRSLSGTKEIVKHWLSKDSDPQREAVCDAYFKVTGKLPSDRAWEETPDILGHSAFIVDHVLPIFYERDNASPGILMSSIHIPINAAYFNSFYTEFRCGGISNMNYLASPVGMSFKYLSESIDYLMAYNSLAQDGLLRRFMSMSSNELISVVNTDQSFGVLYNAIISGFEKV